MKTENIVHNSPYYLSPEEKEALRRIDGPSEPWEDAIFQLAPRLQKDGPGIVSLLVDQCIRATRDDIEELAQNTDDGAVEVACEYYLCSLDCRPRPGIPAGTAPLDDIARAFVSKLSLADKLLLFHTLRLDIIDP